MAITTPYSLELTANEDAKDAVAGTIPDVVATKLKVFLGADVSPGRRQQYVGVLRAAFNKLKSKKGSDQSGATVVIRGDYSDASNGNFVIEAVTTNITDADVAIVVAGNFGINKSGYFNETFNQVVNVLLEKTKGN